MAIIPSRHDSVEGEHDHQQHAAAQRQADGDELRQTLRPLGENERPASLRIATAVAGALAVAVLISALTVHDLSRHGGSLAGGLFLAGVLVALTWGMWARHYWAVLAFEALLAFQIIVTSLALIVAETWLAAGLCTLSIALAGWLFWKLVRVMGRLQARERSPHVDTADSEHALR